MTRSTRLACASLALLLSLWSCRRNAHLYRPLVPVVRIIDTIPASTVPGIAHGTDIVREHETRRTLSVPDQRTVLADLQDAGSGHARQYGLEIPPDLRAWGKVNVLRTMSLFRKEFPRWSFGVDLASDHPALLPVLPGEKTSAQIYATVYSAVPPEATIDTPPLTVPDGGVLAFGIAAHAPTPERIALAARIAVRHGGKEEEIWRMQLSGAETTWRDQQVSLAPFAGRTIQLRFSTQPAGQAQTGLAALFGEPVVLAPRPTPAPPLNVVLISMDTLRARSLGTYGSARPTSPTIDRLANEGVLFENAYSTAAFTLPGHMSLFTGLWFRTHRAFTALSTLSPQHRTLPEMLQSAGYTTGAFTSGAWIMPWLGFRRGFDEYWEQPAAVDGSDTPGGRPYPAFVTGLEWIRTHADRPFFVFLHSYTVHAPYTPPTPYRDLFDPLPPYATEGERRQRLYEQEVRYADDQVRGVLKELETLGLRERTLVVLTADHGEAFGEHGMFEHTYDVHDEIARIPLIMRLPGALPAGRRVAEPVSLVDVAPTILDLVGGLPIPGAEGTSLLPLAAGTLARLPRDGLFTEAESEPSLGWVDLTAVHTRTHTCIQEARTARFECYDQRTDPWEREPPLPPDDASPGVGEARAVLASYLTAHPRTITGEALVGPVEAEPMAPESAAPASPPPPGVDAERKEQLRALGYVE